MGYSSSRQKAFSPYFVPPIAAFVLILAFPQRALLSPSAIVLAAWLAIVYDYIPPTNPLSIQPSLTHVYLFSCICRAHGAGGLYSILGQASQDIPGSAQSCPVLSLFFLFSPLLHGGPDCGVIALIRISCSLDEGVIYYQSTVYDMNEGVCRNQT